MEVMALNDLAQSIERILLEGAESVADLAKTLPAPRGESVAPATLVRWIRHGKKGVLLEGYTKGQGWYSSKPALARFFAALTEQLLPVAVQTVNERRAAAAAERIKGIRSQVK
jgi:hypothetical protein